MEICRVDKFYHFWMHIHYLYLSDIFPGLPNSKKNWYNDFLNDLCKWINWYYSILDMLALIYWYKDYKSLNFSDSQCIFMLIGQFEIFFHKFPYFDLIFR